jgi:hypothetical protein
MSILPWGMQSQNGHHRQPYGRTVQGFGMEYPVKITNINAGTIIFSHSDKQWRLLGQIDRVTGDMEATITDWLDEQSRGLSRAIFTRGQHSGCLALRKMDAPFIIGLCGLAAALIMRRWSWSALTLRSTTASITSSPTLDSRSLPVC